MSKQNGPLVSVEGFSEQPSLEAVAESLGLSSDEIDPSFGVVLIDPRAGKYCVQLKDEPSSHTQLPEDSGPWSNPPIGPLG